MSEVGPRWLAGVSFGRHQARTTSIRSVAGRAAEPRAAGFAVAFRLAVFCVDAAAVALFASAGADGWPRGWGLAALGVWLICVLVVCVLAYADSDEDVDAFADEDAPGVTRLIASHGSRRTAWFRFTCGLEYRAALPACNPIEQTRWLRQRQPRSPTTATQSR